MTRVSPEVIDLPVSSDVIWLTTDGQTVWAAIDDAVLRIDAATNAVTTLEAPSRTGDTTIEIADDGLWMTRWAGSRVYRLDPTTGEVELSIKVGSAVRMAFVGGDLWVGREATTDMVAIDRVSGAIGRSLPIGAYASAGLGDLWSVIGGTVKRIDPASGSVKATIPIGNEGNCSMSGTFPDDAWTSCFGRDVVTRVATLLDPARNEVAATVTLPPCHGGSLVIFDGQTWFVGTFADAAGAVFGGLLRLNAARTAVEQFVSIGPADPNGAVVAGGAIWVPDQEGHRIFRLTPGDLASAS